MQAGGHFDLAVTKSYARHLRRLKEPLPVDDVEFPQDKDLNIVNRRHNMGRGILLWLLGIPLPIVILLVLFLR
ncbi:hypothetical protein CYG48_21275 (plasmid) [Neorhizobium sp. SOG26]|nr:hypothetical protein CYG48_21275 [Neorhizobium sp. SOG26]